MAQPIENEVVPLALDRKQVEAVFGVKKTRLWNGIKSGEFPAPLKLGNMTRWDSLEVLECQKQRVSKAKAARDAKEEGNSDV